ncbi:MAG: hypothetical protein ACRC9P_06830 [Bacteroides sp.]
MVVLVVGMFGLVINYRDTVKRLELINNSLEAQISSIMDDSNDLAELYQDVSNRLNTARILALNGTLRLEDIVLDAEPDSEVVDWSRSKIPQEVLSVLKGYMEVSYDKSKVNR